MNSKGFTLIELIITIAITAVLAGIVLFGVSQYIDKGKDSNISGSLVVLIPAGETYYTVNGNSYSGFCDPTQINGTVIKNVISQMPAQNSNSNAPCYSSSINSTTNPAGVCCNVANDGNSWAACAREFADKNKAWCVDSIGFKEEMCNSSCTNTLTQCPDPLKQTNCS